MGRFGRVVSVENLRDQRKSEKKSRFHGRNVPNGNSCSISSKPFLIRVSAFRDPFFGKCNWLQQMVNAILEGKLPVLNFAYHNLPKPWTNRFAHEIGTNHSSTHVPQGWLRVTERDQAIFGQMAQVAQVLFGFGWPRRVSALLSFLKVLLHSYLTILWVSLFEKKKGEKKSCFGVSFRCFVVQYILSVKNTIRPAETLINQWHQSCRLLVKLNKLVND